MKKYVGKMKKYERNVKEYVENMKRGRARNFSKSRSLFKREKLGILPGLKAYIGGGGVVIVPNPQEK